jgi:hypothetical protein
MGDGGKGSKPRPISVSQEEYDTRWDAIFGRDLKKEEPKSNEQAPAADSTVVNNNSDQQ